MRGPAYCAPNSHERRPRNPEPSPPPPSFGVGAIPTAPRMEGAHRRRSTSAKPNQPLPAAGRGFLLMANQQTYPTGVRPLLIEEAARRRRIETQFVETLESAGFAEVVLPMIDYVDPYVTLV